MKLYIPVAGTWGRKKFRNNDWFRAGSSIDTLLNDLGYARVDQNNDPARPDAGFWSGDVGGLLIQQLFPWMSHDEVWREGAENLVKFFEDRRRELADRDCEEVAIIAHSHGGQVVSFALQTMRDNGEHSSVLPKIRVVTVDMPVRTGKFLFFFSRGMDATYQDALAAVDGRWTHLYSGRGLKSKMRWLGNRFGPRRLRGALLNCQVPGGHSGILRESRWFHVWKDIMSGECPGHRQATAAASIPTPATPEGSSDVGNLGAAGGAEVIPTPATPGDSSDGMEEDRHGRDAPNR